MKPFWNEDLSFDTLAFSLAESLLKRPCNCLILPFKIESDDRGGANFCFSGFETCLISSFGGSCFLKKQHLIRKWRWKKRNNRLGSESSSSSTVGGINASSQSVSKSVILVFFGKLMNNKLSRGGNLEKKKRTFHFWNVVSSLLYNSHKQRLKHQPALL